MYESLTRFIPVMEKDLFGVWTGGRDGGPPRVIYSWNVRALAEAVFCFAEDHCREYMEDFLRALEKHRITWSRKSMKNADVSALDGRTVYALLRGAVRAEKECPGALLYFCMSGCVVRWLRRLREIDEEKRTGADYTA